MTRTAHFLKVASWTLFIIATSGCSGLILEKPSANDVFAEACRNGVDESLYQGSYMEGAMQGVVARQGQSWDDEEYADLRAMVQLWKAGPDEDAAALEDCSATFDWFDAALLNEDDAHGS